jgi:hypothetical protein
MNLGFQIELLIDRVTNGTVWNKEEQVSEEESKTCKIQRTLDRILFRSITQVSSKDMSLSVSSSNSLGISILPKLFTYGDYTG